MQWFKAAPGYRDIGEVPDISALRHDSRQVKPGDGFVAVPGQQADGHAYIGAAVAAGAAAVVVQAGRETRWEAYIGKVPLVVVPDARAAMGPLAAAVHGRPSHRLLTIGVTGTDGKTTTCHLLAHILSAAGRRCGYLTSVGFDTGGGFEPNLAHMTTLEATDIQPMLAAAAGNGLGAMCVEASSEGLAQKRLEGCEFDVAVFRNLSRDHLDFHGTMEAYREAKGRLFEMLDHEHGKAFPKAAVVNADDPASAHMLTRTRQPPVTYGIESPGDVRAADIRARGLRVTFTLSASGRETPADVPLMVVYNALAAVAAAVSQGVGPDAAAAALATFPGVPGRFEVIDCGQPFAVVVDIASTPAAMEYVLRALRAATPGRLWVVFGAAGRRDPARRDGLGRVAGRLADRAVITNEDPRDEDPDAIIEAIAAGLREAGRAEGRDFARVPDRREAVRYAFERAGPGDSVLLAGKATEATMVFATGAVPWDERALARELLGGGRR